jgi:predicted metal-dependent peptidase
VGVDVSGSISLEQFQQFLARIDLIRGLSVIKILETDDEIVALYDYHIGQHEVMRLQGGGGTDFTKAFDLAKKMNPDLILFLTDGMVAPGHVEDPGIPTGWILCHNSENKAPYGFGRVLEVLPELNNN